jgi:hypothetical protein
MPGLIRNKDFGLCRFRNGHANIVLFADRKIMPVIVFTFFTKPPLITDRNRLPVNNRNRVLQKASAIRLRKY